ncbi:hypothetical protein OKW39_008939 [Paraburkholderia sp. MM6662-R1]
MRLLRRHLPGRSCRGNSCACRTRSTARRDSFAHHGTSACSRRRTTTRPCGLSLHESTATQRAYRKEAERLILWAIVEGGCALSSLTTDDAITYRTFLRRPTPRERWVGAARSRQSVEWRPFSGPLSTRSAAYALTVLAALVRWAGRTRLRPRQSVRGCQGARAHEDGSRCQPRLCRRRMAAAPHDRRWPRMVLRPERDGRTTPSVPAGFRVHDRPESQCLTGTTLGDIASTSMAITGCTLSARAARLGRWRSRRWRVGRSTSIWRNAGCRSHVKNGGKTHTITSADACGARVSGREFTKSSRSDELRMAFRMRKKPP